MDRGKRAMWLRIEHFRTITVRDIEQREYKAWVSKHFYWEQHRVVRCIGTSYSTLRITHSYTKIPLGGYRQTGGGWA